jgi:hypothetical protein
MAIQIVMDRTGDSRHPFNPHDVQEVAKAEQRFYELTKAGFTAAVRCGASQRLARSGGQIQARGRQSGCGPTRRSRGRASANEGRRFRSRSTPAKAQPGGKRVLVRAQHCTRRVAQGFRSRQPVRVGRTERLWLEERIMVAKGFLEAQVQQLRAWVSAGYSRGRFDVT